MKKILVIGGGFSGLSCACFLAKNGYEVTLLEKNNTLGGRARKFEKNGYTFDMGPSWYWMPDLFERCYNQLGYSTSDFYELKKLTPSYRIFWEDKSFTDVSAEQESLKKLFDSFEKGAGEKLMKFLHQAQKKYEIATKEFIFKPSLSVFEYMDMKLFLKMLQLNIFSSISQHIKSFVSHPKLRKILEFPILFLGASATRTPALYSMMNYADLVLGTWYPMGGMYKIVEAFERIANHFSVSIKKEAEVTKFEIKNKKITKIHTQNDVFSADAVVSAADYRHIESLLPLQYQSYTDTYWDSRILAPSCMLYYIGLDKKLDNHLHHNLYFDADFPQAIKEIYTTHQAPKNPLFYLSCTSKTDVSTAPKEGENVFILLPISTHLKEKKEFQKTYLKKVIDRIYQCSGEDISKNIVTQEYFSRSHFQASYNAFKGNAYGLANTLRQTGPLKPKIKSKKIDNLFYTGHLTVPGPGVPPAIVSGELVANFIKKNVK